MFSKLALKSLLNRKGSVLLSLLAMTVSVFVLLGVEHVRHQAKESFSNTVSGVDLIVGARTGSLNLLLYSVFKIGAPTNNIHWESFQRINNHSKVKWAIPISLGDSHKGFRVVGTTTDYFEHYKYGKKHSLQFHQGHEFRTVFDVVLGAGIAKKLGYQLGDSIVLAHGVAKTSFTLHDDKPFTVVGILSPTGTPVDQTLHVSLQGIEAIHKNGYKHSNNAPLSQQPFEPSELKPKAITAVFLGLKSKMSTFQVQRAINNDKREPLLAILPGVALSELWQVMGVLEKTLFLVSLLVFVAACLGVSAMLLASIRERTREIQLLRVLGASPLVVFLLIELEALLITVSSILLGAGLLSICLMAAQEYLITEFGLHIENNIFSSHSLYLVAAIIVCASIAAVIPALSGYTEARKSKH